MSESVFLAEGERFLPTEHARGPWDPRTLHGGAPAALITSAFECHEPVENLAIARLGFELLRPIPFAPLTVTVRTVRAGKRVQELAAELHAELRGEGTVLICRASALCLATVPGGLGELPVGALGGAPMPAPEKGNPVRFALDGSERPSFAASAMEMRWLDDAATLGPARVWMRLRHPLVLGEPPSPLARLAATADFGNGVSASLPFADYLFINADLTIHLHRQPRGEWIGLDSRTLLHEGGAGLAESVLHDLEGPVGRAFQALVVAPR
jgi:Thioesterase-like superfamily